MNQNSKVNTKGNKRLVRITQKELLDKLQALDERLINIWLSDESKVSDEEVWEIFVVLLETRVEILKTCKEAGVLLTPEMCLPDWLERLSRRKQELRLREIRVMAAELKKQKNISKYEAHMFSSEEIVE